MTRLEECKKLAEEFGLNGTIAHIEAIKEAAVLANYKIHMTTMEAIKSKIRKNVRKSRIKDIIIMSIVMVAAFGVALIAVVCRYELIAAAGVLTGLAALVGAVCRGESLSDIYVNTMLLKDWEHGLPYGALLAVGEARKLGLMSFCIAYPIAMSTIPDPIIFAEKNKVLYEIFAWDDGKIYE